jgi:hypothetical protein
VSYKVLLIFISVAFLACQKSAAENAEPPFEQPTATVAPPELQKSNGIRKVDFQNLSYTGPEDYPESFALKNGKKEFVADKEDGILLDKIFYDDLTGDGREEAIVRMSIQTGGSAIPSLVFIYTLEGETPRTLWKFISGDRAEGGLRDVYAKEGLLVIELFGNSNFVNDTWESTIPEGKFKGLCCPTVYTKTKFGWDGRRFAVNGTPEVFDIFENSHPTH